MKFYIIHILMYVHNVILCNNSFSTLIYLNILIFQTDAPSPPSNGKYPYTNSNFENQYNMQDQHQIYNQINNNQPLYQHEPQTHHQHTSNNNRNKRGTSVSQQQRGAVSQQNTPQLKKHLMFNQTQQVHQNHIAAGGNSINYNNNQNHYQRQQSSFDHYSPLLIADDQHKLNQFDNNTDIPQQIQPRSMNGNTNMFLKSIFLEIITHLKCNFTTACVKMMYDR